MTQNDVLTLARAGFTAQQISALAQMQPVQQMQQMQPVEQMQPVQQMQPAQQMQPVGDPFVQQLAKLTQAIQENGILSTQQPNPETADEVLASIINPPKNDNK